MVTFWLVEAMSRVSLPTPCHSKTDLDQYKNRLQTTTSTSPTSTSWPSPTSTTSSPTPTIWACSPKKSPSLGNRWVTRPRHSVTWPVSVRRLTWTGWVRGRKRVELVPLPLSLWGDSVYSLIDWIGDHYFFDVLV